MQIRTLAGLGEVLESGSEAASGVILRVMSTDGQLLIKRAIRKLSPTKPDRTIVGSEKARLRASLRPPPKLHVRFSRMQLSRRHRT